MVLVEQPANVTHRDHLSMPTACVPGHDAPSSNERPDEPAARAFRQHRREIYRFLLRRTRNREDAEDLTQEVFADAVTALERFHPGATPVLSLLYTIARRRFADAMRAQARSPRATPPADGGSVAEPVSRADEHEVVLAIRTALEELPPEMREVVTMKLILGRSFSEIAERSGVSEVACRKRFQRALAILRAELTAEGDER